MNESFVHVVGQHDLEWPESLVASWKITLNKIAATLGALEVPPLAVHRRWYMGIAESPTPASVTCRLHLKDLDQSNA